MAAEIPRFTEKLRWAFENVPGPDGHLLTTERFVRLIPSQGVEGVEISVSYGNQLRSGQKAAPTAPLLEAITRVFALPSEFWWDDEVEVAIREGAAVLTDATRAARRGAAEKHVQELVARLSRLDN